MRCVTRRVPFLFHCLGSLVAIPIFLIVTGCGSHSSLAPVTLSLVTLSPASDSLVAGATQQIKATATYNDGTTADITAQAAWTSSNTSVATVSASGMLDAVAAGTATVTASFKDVNGSSSVTVSASVPNKTLTAVAVTPATASFAVGATQQFKATGSYSDGSTADVSSTASWSINSNATATITAAGLATGVAAGTATVTASLQGISGTAAVTVTAATSNPTLVSIAVTPANASIAVGATQQFTATGTYSDKSTADISSTVTWAASNTAVATVKASGLATAAGAGTANITATLSGVTGTASLTVTATAKTVKSLAITPATPSIPMGSTQQLTATATYTDNTTANVTASVTWSAVNTAVASVSTAGVASAAASGTTTIKAVLDSVTATVTFTSTYPVVDAVNVPTWHYDNNRTGNNSHELSLTPANVSASTFGKMFSYLVDGYVYAEPLVRSNITVSGVSRNVLYVATENDTVYAFDADNPGTGAPLWQTSLLQAGETPLTGAAIKPVLGITSTPVIDTATNTIYVISTQKPANASASFRLNALDLSTGAHKFGSPVTITASVAGTNSSAVNGMIPLTTSCIQRAALLLANNTVYIGFGSCHDGWLLGYDSQTLAQTGVFNSSPNLDGEGTYASAGGIWMGAGGPASNGDSGNVFVTTGNGPWDGKTAWADSVLQFNPKLALVDYFTPQDYQYMDCADADLAAGGLMLLPGTSYALAGGKTGKMYLIDTTNMGHMQANDAGAAQSLFFEPDLSPPYSATCTDSTGANTTQINSYEIFGTASWYNSSVFLGITPTGATTPAGVRQFPFSGTLSPGPYTTQSVQQNTRGTTAFVSSNSATNGILWMIDTGHPIQNTGGLTPTSAVLRAYDADHFPNEIYASSTNAGDAAGLGIKFTSPVVANGKVYIPTGHDTSATPQGEIDVYGLK